MRIEGNPAPVGGIAALNSYIFQNDILFACAVDGERTTVILNITAGERHVFQRHILCGDFKNTV